MTLKTACQKPTTKAPRPPRALPKLSAKKLQSLGGKIPFSTISSGGSQGKKIRSGNPQQRSRRRLKNAKYYASAEWKAKKKAVHERDGYRCVEMIPYTIRGGGLWTGVGLDVVRLRCPNMGMNINGKQTSKGLVAEEKSYGHRGTPGAIDRIVTRCKDCDRRLTPLERANHAHGFSGHSGASE